MGALEARSCVEVSHEELAVRKFAHAGSRTRVTSMGGLYDTATLHARLPPVRVAGHYVFWMEPRVVTFAIPLQHLRPMVSVVLREACALRDP